MTNTMKTKKVTLSRATASFSTASSHMSIVTLSRAPWDNEPDHVCETEGRADREPGRSNRGRGMDACRSNGA